METTTWRLIRDVVHGDSKMRASGLSELCERYREPVYHHIRRHAVDDAEADDLTQSFFLVVIQGDFLSRPSPMLGRFRTFLIQALTWHIANERRLNRAVKRGGNVQFVQLREDHLACETVVLRSTSEDVRFNRDWSLHFLSLVLDTLKESYTKTGRAEVFDALKGFLTVTSTTPTPAEASALLGMPEASVRVAISRLRARFRALVREEILKTVSSEDEIDDEIRVLMDHVAAP